jgi:hypothetical protein
MKRFGSTRWNGGLREGKGAVSTESRGLENYPYSFFTRYGDKPGTNPEELLGAARPLSGAFPTSEHAGDNRNLRKEAENRAPLLPLAGPGALAPVQVPPNGSVCGDKLKTAERYAA